MTQVAVIGCGVVGAAIAYELSQVPGLVVTVLDQQPPAQAATGAALGVLMGVISQKTQGNAWNMRQTSIQHYEALIPELEAITNSPIPFNRQGILMLCFDEPELSRWEALVQVRQSQGWQLEIWNPAQVKLRCPQIDLSQLAAAVYSPQDRQVDPTALTLALVTAAEQNGVTFRFDTPVEGLESGDEGALRRCRKLQTAASSLTVDWVVVAAGLGSTLLTQAAIQPLDIRPVLGQALHLRLAESMGDRHFQPVITGKDIHIVPIGKGEYWIGATVEFLTEDNAVTASSDRLQEVIEGAIAFCPILETAKVLKTWSGLRPRPHNRPAPIIEPLAGYSNVLLATGHYRNGVLLAPATAQAIRAAITRT